MEPRIHNKVGYGYSDKHLLKYSIQVNHHCRFKNSRSTNSRCDQFVHLECFARGHSHHHQQMCVITGSLSGDPSWAWSEPSLCPSSTHLPRFLSSWSTQPSREALSAACMRDMMALLGERSAHHAHIMTVGLAERVAFMFSAGYTYSSAVRVRFAGGEDVGRWDLLSIAPLVIHFMAGVEGYCMF